MRRIPPIEASLVLMAVLPLACRTAPEPAPAGPPNVLLIFTDDQGWADVGVYGAKGFDTPELDRLAAEGVRMTDFYVAQPVCSASRAALLTGCYPTRIGIRGALGPSSEVGLHEGEVTLAELCKSRGYATAIYGKWHLGYQTPFLPRSHGFDEFYGIPYSNDMWPGHPENPKAWGDLPTLENEQAVGFNTDQSRFTGDFTDRAVEFIRRNAEAGVPFFAYVPHPMPHVPLHVSAPFVSSSAQGTYGDVIQEIDASVGKLLRTLDECGVTDNTLVIFTSDNGPWLSYGNHAGSTGPFREGKGTTFEGGVRVPCLVRFPGRIPAGTVCREPAMTIDLFPTVARLIGAALPSRKIDGQDIWPLLAGEPGATSPQEAYFFYYHGNNLEALRRGRWKLHFPHKYRSMEGRQLGSDGIPGKYDYGRTIGLELFDLEGDPGESVDVSADHPELMLELLALADAMRTELGDGLTERKGVGVRPAGTLD